MTPDEIHTLLAESEPPFTIATKGGRSYRVASRSDVWVPDAYPDMLCLVIAGKGIVVLRASAIESIQVEHDPAAVVSL